MKNPIDGAKQLGSKYNGTLKVVAIVSGGVAILSGALALLTGKKSEAAQEESK